MTVDHPFAGDAQLPHLCGRRDGGPHGHLCGRPERDHAPAGPPAPEPTTEAEAPPEWWTAATPPDWALEDLAEVSDWRNLGDRRWQGALADLWNPGALADLWNPDLLVLVNAAGTGFMRFALCIDDEPDPAFITDRLFTDMQDRLDYETLPTCAAPGCGQKAPCEFTAAAAGQLAGKPRVAGEVIRFCWPHGNDVMVAGAGGNVAEWLRPDAFLTPEDALTVAVSTAYDDDGRDIHTRNAELREALARVMSVNRSESS